MSREELESTEKYGREALINNLPLQFTDKQVNAIRDMNNKIKEENTDVGLIAKTELKYVNYDELKGKYQSRYEDLIGLKEPNASDRQIREKAETKTKTAMKLHKQLLDLCGSIPGVKNVATLNYTIHLLNNYDPTIHKKLDKDRTKKLNALKKRAPEVYERLFRLEHVEKMLRASKNQFQDLYNLATNEIERAKYEWGLIESRTSELVVEKPILIKEEEPKNKIVPKIDSKKEKAQIKRFKDLHNRFVDMELEKTKKDDEIEKLKAKQRENKVNDAPLDNYYKKDLAENLKKTTVDWSILEEKKFNELKKRVRKNNPDPKDIMNYNLAVQMKKILADPENKGVTPKQVESTVNEYFERMLEKSEFHARFKLCNAIKILETRYFSQNLAGYYNLKKKQYSESSPLDPKNCLSFGSLGARTSEGLCGNRPGVDPVRCYGDTTIRLNKQKMKGRVSFVCGNSKGGTSSENLDMPQFDYYDIKHGRAAYVDKKAGHGPDIKACGENLPSIYKRAKELKANNWEGIKDGGSEAPVTITDNRTFTYYEAHYHGNVGVAEIDEVSFILNGASLNLKNMTDIDMKYYLVDNKDFRDLYDHINIINKNPEVHDREGMGDLKLSVWDTYGNTMTFEEVKALMEGKKTKKK
ncbi:MAG: hypothetical protein K6C96_01995 [Butyrivibrio sp.]|nr:hypothetical protein [Butyrivibrio sp.]